MNTASQVQRDSTAGVLATGFVFDPTGRLTSTSQGNRTSTYAYDGLGRTSTITNPKGEVRRLGYDAADRPTFFVSPLGDTSRVGYDSVGRIISVKPAGRPAHLLTYSPVGLLTSYVPPDVGDGAQPVRLQYDAVDRLTHFLRQAGDSLVFTYDSTGRTTSMRSAETMTSYTYSPTTGHLTSITAPTRGTLSFLYDGALVTRNTWSGVITGNVGFTYDSDLRVSAQTVNGANSISFTYDADSRLTSAGALTIVRDANNGRITGTALGSVTGSVTYDGYSIPNRLVSLYAGNPIFDLQYLHDSLGRIVSVTEVITGVTATYGYSYDAAGRLLAVTKNGAPEASYSFDANGNRTSLTTTLGTISVTTDAQDRILSQGTTTFRYTKDGELREAISGVDTTRFTYGARAELLSVRLPNGTLIEYVHDPQGRRIGKKLNGTLMRGWLYGTGLGPVAELDGNNNIVSRFVYASRPHVPDYMIKAGVTYRLMHDHLGSVRLVVNTSTGAVVQRLDYDAWGVVLANTAPNFQPFGFAGGLFDAQTGLARFGARDYAPTQGHFTTRDPDGFSSGSTNLRRYANADPVNQVDPGGDSPYMSLVSALTFAEIMWSASASFIAGCTVGLNEASAKQDGAPAMVRACLGGALPSVTATAIVHVLHIDDIPVLGPCLAGAAENALGFALDKGPRIIESKDLQNQLLSSLAAGCAGGELARLASKSLYPPTRMSYADHIAMRAFRAVAENAFTTYHRDS